MIDILLKLGGLQAIILSLFLIRKKENWRANLILALFVFALGTSCLFHSFNTLDFYIKFPHLIRIDWGIPLLFGPLVYLYTLFLTDGQKRWSDKLNVHFIPYLINLAILLPFFIKSSEEKILILDYFTAAVSVGTDNYVFYNYILKIAISVIGVSYTVSSILVLKGFHKNILQEFSDVHRIKLDWLQMLLYSFLVISVVFVITSILYVDDIYPLFDYNVFYFLFIFVFIYAISYKTMTLPIMVSTQDIFQINKDIKKVIQPNKELSRQAIVLNDFMVETKPFLNGDLTASQLAVELNITRHQLSEVLNEEIGSNFYDYINSFRIREFKKRVILPENERLTLLAIAYDSGFNSKTSFNTAFKKITGLTPSQYKKSQK